MLADEGESAVPAPSKKKSSPVPEPSQPPRRFGKVPEPFQPPGHFGNPPQASEPGRMAQSWRGVGIQQIQQRTDQQRINRWRKPIDQPPSKNAVNIPAEEAEEAQENIKLAHREVVSALQSHHNVVRPRTSIKDTHNGITHYIILMLLKSVWHGITDFVSKHNSLNWSPQLPWSKWKHKGGRLAKNWDFIKENLEKRELPLNSPPIEWTTWLTAEDVEWTFQFESHDSTRQASGQKVGPRCEVCQSA